MICRTCLRAVARTRIPSSTSSSSSQPGRLLSSSTPRLNATPITTTPSKQATQTSAHTPLAATASITPQPLSDPLTPSAKKDGAAKPKQQPLVKSSIPAGTPLKGLNFLKNQGDPIAMEDSEYPAWLWEILKKQEKKAEAGAAGDLFSKSKKQRRLAAKRLRKEQLANPEMMIPKVPIYEQTVDLPAGDGTAEGAMQAANAREELTKAMRTKRRATIKEANFLKAMG